MITTKLNLPKAKEKKGFTQKEFENWIANRPSYRESNGAFQRLVDQNNINNKKFNATEARTALKKGSSNTKVREENAIERINRINYEFGQTKKRPEHLDNKNIISWEDKQTKKQIKKIAERPKPIKPDLVNGHSDWNTDDWLESIDPGGWASPEDEGKRRTQVEENLLEKYLELMKAGELLPGTTFKMFEKNFYDFDTDVITKIKKRADEKKRVEGLAALLGVDPGRTTI